MVFEQIKICLKKRYILLLPIIFLYFILPVVTKASSEFQIKTGYYYGNGTELSVKGIGFKPELLLIKSNTAAGQLVWKSSVMPSQVVSYLGVATPDNTESEITFNDNGFTVSRALEVNTKNVRYNYIAFYGSDCTSADSGMCIGKYTGDGLSSQNVPVGFSPDLVWVKRTGAVVGNFTTSDLAAMNPLYGAYFSATVNDFAETGLLYKSLNADGFTVGLTNNVSGAVYYYVGFKKTVNKFITGVFTGNGYDNRNITGTDLDGTGGTPIGFEPDFVFVKQNSAVGPVFNTTECWGDYSLATIAGAAALNHIQDLHSDGFQVGNSTAVNASSILSTWFAFGGAPDPAPTESFFMERGSYEGDGNTSKIINTSFPPDLVFIKARDAVQYAVWSTRMDTDITHYFALAGASFAGGIISMQNDSFTVGSHATVNTSMTNYEWVAFGNATSPQDGARAADFVIGSYPGNGLTPTTAPRTIDHLGITPNFVLVKPSVVTNASNINFWKSSSMTGVNETAYIKATANDVSGTLIRSLDTDGFTIGSSAYLNANAIFYHFFAFKEGNGIFKVGSYDGTEVADREVAGLGFQPDLVWVKRNTATAAVYRSSSPGIINDLSQHFMNIVDGVNMITGFLQDGFKVGTSVYTNSSTAPPTYHYAAWKGTSSVNPPVSPENIFPTSGGIGVSLNTTLTGSNFGLDEGSHINTQWQVDDDSDFSSPVWTRTSGVGEITTIIASTSGIFSNELSDKTELNHNSVYYWRVKYFNGVWSPWSDSTNFVTNIINNPSNSSPADGEIVTSLTPILSAEAFSDEQPGHTFLNAEWQINTTNDFSSPLYDSGVVAYSSSHAVPSAVLSDRVSYFWRVRYQDSSGQWSNYSSATKFNVSESVISVTPVFGKIVVDQGDVVKIDAQVKLNNGTILNDANVTISIYNPLGNKIVTNENMIFLADSSGIYRFSYTIPDVSGSYLYEVRAISDGITGYGAANFEVRTINADVGDIQSKVESLQDNIDILLGAFVSARSSVNDESATTNSFVTNLINTTDNFFKNSVLTFTSGNLNGQARRISSYDGGDKIITVSPALTSAPGNGDNFTIVKQNVYMEEQAENIQSDVSILKDDISYIKSKVDDVYNLLQTVDTDLSTIQTNINEIRFSQQKFYEANITDISEISIGKTYKTKLTLRDYEGSPVDPPTIPIITIYDSLSEKKVDAEEMTKESVGVYTYAYKIPSDANAGIWEASIVTTVGDLPNQVLTDYFKANGSMAQVLVSGISDQSVPSIVADITITNEGEVDDFDYLYEWCVVSDQDNTCGGGDDIDYGSGAKRILQGEDWNTSLNATVLNTGDYWFKLIVHWGDESSGASRAFTAATSTSIDTTKSSSGTGGKTQVLTLSSIHSEILEIKNDLKKTAEYLVLALDTLGIKKSGSQSLLQMSDEQLFSFKQMQNKLTELGAVSSSIRQVVEQSTVNPVVETYMNFNSVEINFLIINPANTKQTLSFKSFLPEEVKPEHIMSSDGLKVNFDTNANIYYVSTEIELGPKESINKKVEMKDIWIFSTDELLYLSEQAEDITNILKGTQYEAQGVILKNSIQGSVEIVIRKQKESYSSPQEHIIVYRDNKIIIKQINDNFDKLKDLVVQSGVTTGLFGRLGGIQVFTTWGIILAIIFGFGLIGMLIFSMWKNQILMTEEILSNYKKIKVEKEIDTQAIEKIKKIQDKEMDRRRKKFFKMGKKIIYSLIFFSIIISLAVFFFSSIRTSRVITFRQNKDETPVLPTEDITIKDNNIKKENDLPLAEKITVDMDKEDSIDSVHNKIIVLKTPTGWLNVRQEDSLEADILGKIYTGEEYTYLKERNNWYLINFSGTQTGWISGIYVKKIN